jgi:alpha-glucosidase (family GH31 glycosyl hydrolase)
MAELHVQHADTFLALARHAAKTGEPIVRPLCWRWPGLGFEAVVDQFMVGDDLMVAPVVRRGATTRSVVFPPGRWVGEEGSETIGPLTKDIDVPLTRLPRFRRRP